VLCKTTKKGRLRKLIWRNDLRAGDLVALRKNGEGADRLMAVWLGFVAAAVAVVFFGSQLLPVKRFETGDGLFFQWVLCVGIWLVGLTVQQVQQPFLWS